MKYKITPHKSGMEYTSSEYNTIDETQEKIKRLLIKGFTYITIVSSKDEIDA